MEGEIGLKLLESPLNPEQRIDTFADRLEVTAVVVETVQLHRWLLGFGNKVWGITLKEVGGGYAQEGEDALRHILS